MDSLGEFKTLFNTSALKWPSVLSTRATDVYKLVVNSFLGNNAKHFQFL